MVAQPNLTWPKTGAHQHWPEVAAVVIHLVVVHLKCRGDAEAKRRKFEEYFPTPCGNIHDEYTIPPEQSMAMNKHFEGIAKMFEH